MKENIIYIKPEEEITSVVDKLMRCKREEVFLVIPKGAAIGQSLVNLKLLKREANNMEKAVTIVTTDETLERLAKKTDFLVSDSLPETQEKEEIFEEEEEGADNVEGDEQIVPEIAEEEEERPVRLNFSPQMVDIVQRQGASHPKGGLFLEKIKKVSDKAALFFEKKLSSEISADREEVQSEKKPSGSFFEAKPFAEKSLPAFPVKIFAFFIVAAVLIGVLLFALVLPKAEITLGAKKETVLIDMAITADKNISRPDSGQNKVPAQIIKIEQRQSGDFKTTGERQLNEKAKGKILVFNSENSSPQPLIANTRFLSSDGRIFRLLKSTTIPGAKVEKGNIVPGQLEVEVEADQPGEEYNIGPSNFTLPALKEQGSAKYSTVYGKSSKAMAGGSTGKVKVVTQDDFDKAKDSVLASLDGNIKEEIIGQTPEGFRILEDSIQVQEPEIIASAQVGEKAENFNMSAKVVARAFVFLEQDVLSLVSGNLTDQVSDKKEAVEGARFEYKDIEVSFDEGKASFRVEGTQPIAWKVDGQAIKEVIMGKTEADVRSILSKRPEVEKAEVSFWPFWVSKIPERGEKIELTVK